MVAARHQTYSLVRSTDTDLDYLKRLRRPSLYMLWLM